MATALVAPAFTQKDFDRNCRPKLGSPPEYCTLMRVDLLPQFLYVPPQRLKPHEAAAAAGCTDSTCVCAAEAGAADKTASPIALAMAIPAILDFSLITAPLDLGTLMSDALVSRDRNDTLHFRRSLSSFWGTLAHRSPNGPSTTRRRLRTHTTPSVRFSARVAKR